MSTYKITGTIKRNMTDKDQCDHITHCNKCNALVCSYCCEDCSGCQVEWCKECYKEHQVCCYDCLEMICPVEQERIFTGQEPIEGTIIEIPVCPKCNMKNDQKL